MNDPRLIISNQMEEFICIQRFKQMCSFKTEVMVIEWLEKYLNRDIFLEKVLENKLYLNMLENHFMALKSP